MKIEETIDEERIKKIITNPRLWKATYGQGENVADYKVDYQYKYLMITNDNEDIGVYQVRDVTRITIEAHIFILPKYWGKENISLDAVKAGHNWARSNGYHSVLTSVPANCIHMLKFMSKIKYVPCGMITKGIIYNNYLVSLFFFEYDLEKSE